MWRFAAITVYSLCLLLICICMVPFLFAVSLILCIQPYLELHHGREDGYMSSHSSATESLSRETAIVFDYNDHPANSAHSCDSGRSTDSVFTFSSCDIIDDITDSSEEKTLERKISVMNELLNPGYGIAD